MAFGPGTWIATCWSLTLLRCPASQEPVTLCVWARDFSVQVVVAGRKVLQVGAVQPGLRDAGVQLVVRQVQVGQGRIWEKARDVACQAVAGLHIWRALRLYPAQDGFFTENKGLGAGGRQVQLKASTDDS